MGPGIVGQFDVTVAVTNNKGAAQIDAEFSDGPPQHPCFRLSTIAVPAVRRIPRRRMMWTVIYGIKKSSGLNQLIPQSLVNLQDQFFSKITSGHPCLVGDYDDYQSLLIEQPYGLGGPRENLQPGGMVDISHLFADRAIPIEENPDLIHTTAIFFLALIRGIAEYRARRSVEHLNGLRINFIHTDTGHAAMVNRTFSQKARTAFNSFLNQYGRWA